MILLQGQEILCKVLLWVTAHDWETDHPRVVFIDPNDLSQPLSLTQSILVVD